MRFTIRDLLWLTVVVALGVGWWQQSRHYADMEKRAAAERKEFEATYARMERRYGGVEHALLKRDMHVVQFYSGKIAIAPDVPNPSAPAPKTPKD